MTEAEIAAAIEQIGPWFHKIELPYGLTTKTESFAGEPADHPLGTWRILKECLPEDLTGKSVLDVGCNAGFYSIQAKRRNAKRVLGVDQQRLCVSQARFVDRALGLGNEFRRLSLYDLDPAQIGRFDVVLALGLIYHCKHIIQGLERLFDVCKGLLILESAILPPDRTPEPLPYPSGNEVKRILPLGYMANDPSAKEAVENWFMPSPESLEAMLIDVGFTQVEVFSVANNRAVLTAQRPEARPGDVVVSALRTSLSLEHAPPEARAGEKLRYRVSAENSGTTEWQGSDIEPPPTGTVRLGAHLCNEHGDLVSWDYGRAAFARNVAPGETLSIEIELPSPDEPGAYRIEFDLVCEGVTWFEDVGSPPIVSELEVR